MRRVICFMLAIVMVMAMACTAFAAAPSGGNEPGTGGSCNHGKDHDYNKHGVCRVCGEKCHHKDHNKNGICRECGIKVDHVYKKGECIICGKDKPSSGSGSGSSSSSSNGNPKTGDMMIMPYAAAMVSSAAALAFVYRKKRA